MADYRWNAREIARSYDRAAEEIHPHYAELQQFLLDQLPYSTDQAFILVDVGGGSGRLAEQVLRRFAQARVIVIDQSEPALEIATERMADFEGRGDVITARLQEDWSHKMDGSPNVIVSMSAVHHLETEEKHQFYRRCFDALGDGGLLMNADECRPEEDAVYLAVLQNWAERMQRIVHEGKVGPEMAEVLRGWERRNIAEIDRPKSSGDDCHDTADLQIEMLRQLGFEDAEVIWNKELWSVLKGVKS